MQYINMTCDDEHELVYLHGKQFTLSIYLNGVTYEKYS